jgi:hypothetical protein
VNPDVIIVTESKEFLPRELCAIVRDYGVQDPKAVDDVHEELDSLFTPDLHDRPGLYPLGELVYGDKGAYSPVRLLEGPDQVKSLDRK